jgi:Papain family cysteine protease
MHSRRGVDQLQARAARSNATHLIDGMLMLETRVDLIKAAVYRFGAVGVAIDGQCLQSSPVAMRTGYLRPTGPSSGAACSTAPNHNVVIIGWLPPDAQLSNATEVGRHGWLIALNSWGTAQGDHGYFYLPIPPPTGPLPNDYCDCGLFTNPSPGFTGYWDTDLPTAADAWGEVVQPKGIEAWVEEIYPDIQRPHRNHGG